MGFFPGQSLNLLEDQDTLIEQSDIFGYQVSNYTTCCTKCIH